MWILLSCLFVLDDFTWFIHVEDTETILAKVKPIVVEFVDNIMVVVVTQCNIRLLLLIGSNNATSWNVIM